MNAWDNLPNAKYIDQVLADLKASPEAFARAWIMGYVVPRAKAWVEARAAARAAARDAAWLEARAAARDAAWLEARAAARDAAWLEALHATRDAAWLEAQDNEWVGGPGALAGRDAVLAFIAYDDSGKYIDMSYEKLKIWAELSEEPAAVLLLPYVLVQEQYIIQV